MAAKLAEDWLATVGRFAQEAARERVPLRRFLQTYHLGVIREGLLVSPLLIGQLALEDLDEEERLLAFGGLALVDLAARYNSMAPQQRHAVYAEECNGTVYGPLLRHPRRLVRSYWSLRNRTTPRLILRRHHFRSARRFFRFAAEAFLNESPYEIEKVGT